jgi:two-component system, cell cycle response regulator DivK
MKPRVLLIEDNEQNIYLTTFLLRTNGFEVVEARNGNEGISSAQQAAPDLILLDIELPGMDGYAVARELRRQPGLDSVPIVAVTSYAMVGDREKALSAGCTDYIEKPINPDTFVGQVAKHLPAGKGGGPCPGS